jgi:hypothetical protein
MAITVVQSVTAAFPQGGAGNTAAPTLTSVVAGHSIAVVTFGLGFDTGGSPVISVSDGTSYSSLAAINAVPISSNYSMCDISLLTNVAGGTHNCVSTNSAGSGNSFGWAAALEISGLFNSSTLDTSSTNTSSVASNPVTGNTSVVGSTNEIAIATFSFRASGSSTITGPGGSWTNIYQNTNGSGNDALGSIDYLTPVTLAAQSATWNPPTGSNWVAAIVVLKGTTANSGVVGWVF